MIDSLNQAIKAKILGPLFKKGCMGVNDLLYLRFGLGPLRAAKRREEFSYGRTKSGLLYCSSVIGMR